MLMEDVPDGVDLSGMTVEGGIVFAPMTGPAVMPQPVEKKGKSTNRK